MLIDHPERISLASELHARPFPQVMAPASAAYLAITSAGSAAKDRAILVKLLKAMGMRGKSLLAITFSGILGIAC